MPSLLIGAAALVIVVCITRSIPNRVLDGGEPGGCLNLLAILLIVLVFAAMVAAIAATGGLR
jgi:hypothetical protein